MSKTSDFEDRAATISNVAESTFIEAGAGTGKTETIARRIIATVCAPGSLTEIESTVAITFTERAGAELRARIGRLLGEYEESKAVEMYGLVLDRERVKRAFDNVGAANIGTIHSFALWLLQRYPVQAGLPLMVSMQDSSTQSREREELANLAIAEMFNDLSDDYLDDLLDAGIKTSDIRKLLVSLQELWLNIPPDAIERLSLRDEETEFKDFVTNFNQWFTSAKASFDARKEKDKSEELIEFMEIAQKLRDRIAVVDLEARDIEVLVSKLADSGNKSKEIKDFRKITLGVEIGNKGEITVVPLVHLRAHNVLVTLLKDFVADIDEALRQRAKLGALNFDDLLLLARDLVIDPENLELVQSIRKQLLLFVVDEFQDTDLTQWELIRTLATIEGGNAPAPGRLVVVGDPKQSIYRFRGADVETYTAVRNDFTTFEGSKRRQLITNFRSNEHVVKFVNEVFAHESLAMTSIAYQPIEANLTENRVGGIASDFVKVIPGSVGDKAESGVVATYCRKAVDEGWQIRVRDSKSKLVSLEKAKFGNIAVLIPTRTSQDDLLESLFYQNVPIRTFDSGIVYSRPLVKGLIDAARALSGSDNQMHLWFALKSPLFGFSDDDLLDYKLRNGVWDLKSFHHDANYAGTNVGVALAALTSISQRLESSRPHELLTGILSTTNAIQAHAVLDRGYFEIDCLRLFLHQAKSWQSTSQGGLIAYLDWLDDYLSAEGFERLSHPDSEHVNAVEISTIHGVKGLEFPIVFVAGLGKTYQNRPKPLLVHPAGPDNHKSIEFEVGKVQTAGHKVMNEESESKAVASERMRLLYVAATRARDYLVYSGVTREDNKSNCWSNITKDAILAAEATGCFGHADEQGKFVVVDDVNPIAISVPLPEGFDDVVSHVSEQSKRAWVINPSSAAKNDQDESDDQTSEIHIEREDGTEDPIVSEGIDRENEAQFGVVFHKAMELIASEKDIFGPDKVAEYVDRAMSAVGYAEDREEIFKRVGFALESDVVSAALESSEVFPEINVRGVVDNPDGTQNLVVGTADLVYTSGGQLIVIDYKTGNMNAHSESVYRAQLDLYKQLFIAATGNANVRCLILQVGSNGAKVHEYF